MHDTVQCLVYDFDNEKQYYARPTLYYVDFRISINTTYYYVQCMFACLRERLYVLRITSDSSGTVYADFRVPTAGLSNVGKSNVWIVNNDIRRNIANRRGYNSSHININSWG